MEVRGNHYLTQQSSTYGHLLPQLVNFEEKFNWNYFCTVISQTRFSHCFLYAWINKFFLTKYRLPVWKFQNFYVKSFEFWSKTWMVAVQFSNPQILREINLGDSRSAKPANSAICISTFRDSQFWLLSIFALFDIWTLSNSPNSELSKNGKNSIFRTSRTSKIDFT